MGAAHDERAERRLDRFASAAVGTYVWTRTAGEYHLGRLTGGLREDRSADAIAADLIHIRACEWLGEPIDAALVPEQVSHAFSRGGRNLQRIRLSGALEATREVWRRVAQ